MRIADTGREYAKWTVDAPPAAVLAVTFDGETWFTLERVTDTEVRALVAGPHAVDNPADTPVLKLGANSAFIRVVDSPESVVRSAGTIYVFAV